MIAVPQTHAMSIAPLFFQKRLSAAIVLAWLIVALAPVRTRADMWDNLKPNFVFGLRPVVLAPGLSRSQQKNADTKLNNVETSMESSSELRGVAKGDDCRFAPSPMGLHTYGLMFAPHSVLPTINRASRTTSGMPQVAHNLNMQSPDSSATLKRCSELQLTHMGGVLLPSSDSSATLKRGAVLKEKRATSTYARQYKARPVLLSLEKTPILGQFEQVAESLAPIFMLIIMAILAGSSSAIE